jgi:phosphoserine phosphatase
MSIEGFAVQDEASVETKVNDFQERGADSLHVLLDFDRTITVGQSGEDDATTWQVLFRHLPPEAQEKYQAYYSQYRPLEVSGAMTEEDARTWTSSILDLFVEYKVNLNLVEKDFMNVVGLRPGFEELVTLCERHSVPLIVFSAGIRNVIDLLFSLHNLKSSVTLSTELDVDESGLIIGWDRSSLVHVFNKRESGHAELKRIRQQRPLCVLVGDSILDADMVEGNSDVIRIRIVDPRPDEVQDTEAIKTETFSKFDLINETQAFHAVSKLIETVVSKP